jgi:hypothetical protein
LAGSQFRGANLEMITTLISSGSHNRGPFGASVLSREYHRRTGRLTPSLSGCEHGGLHGPPGATGYRRAGDIKPERVQSEASGVSPLMETKTPPRRTRAGLIVQCMKRGQRRLMMAQGERQRARLSDSRPMNETCVFGMIPGGNRRITRSSHVTYFMSKNHQSLY